MMLSATSATPLRPWSSATYSLLEGFVTPFRPSPTPNVPQSMSIAEYQRLALAGTYMRAAVTPGQGVQHLTSLEAIQGLRTYYSFSSQLLIWLALLGLIFLTFFEDGPSQVSPTITLLIEGSCLAVLFWKMTKKRAFMGPSAFTKDASSIINLCLLSVLVLDYCIGLFPHPGPYGQGEERVYRYGRALRPFLIMDHAPSVRQRLSDLCIAGWRARTTFLLVAFNLIFFSVIATILFHNLSSDDPGYESFSSLSSSLVTLIILQTTSNSPDVFVPFFYESRWSSLFFIVFLIMSHFLLLNLMLGVVYHEHIQRLRMAAADELLDSYVAARASMAVLADDVGTNRGEDEVEFSSVVKMLSMEFGMSDAAAKKLLHRCGATIDGVTREHFSKIPKAIMLRMSSFEDLIAEDEDEEEEHEEGLKVRLKRRIRHALTLKLVGHLSYVDAFIVATLLLMLVSLMSAINYDFDTFLEAESEGFTIDIRSRAFWSGLLTVAFGLELCVKLFAFGVFRFSDDLWNIFDSICVILSLLGVLEVFSPKASVLLTEARLMRLLRVIPGFRNVVGIAAAFAPAVGPSISAIFCVFFTTAVTVVGVLGHVRLAPEDYKANDFRDFTAAMVTLFQLSIVNDWNSTMAAFVVATSAATVRIFFIAWWAISQLLLYNTVTSLVLDAFEVRMKEIKAIKETDDKVRNGQQVQMAGGRVPFRPPSSPSPNEFRQLSLLRSLSSGESRGSSNLGRRRSNGENSGGEPDPLLRGTSFTVGRMFLELFRDISEPSDHEVDIACWERGIRVGKSPYTSHVPT